MSYTPDPDTAEMREVMRQDFAGCQTPLTPSHPSHDSTAAYSNDCHWPSIESAEDAFAHTDTSSWCSDMPRGLGLHTANASDTSMYHHIPSPMDTRSMSDKWPPVFAPAFPGHVHTEMVRKDSTLDCCDPLSTLLPVSSPWDHLQNTATTFLPPCETSPPGSEYSTGSLISTADSSPYATSEHGFRICGSPFIKLEDLDQRPRLHSLPGAVHYERSMLVHPSDVYASPSLSAVEQRVMDALVPAAKFESGEDVGRQRPHNPRTQSLKNPRADAREDRRKRGFTTHANSTCACETCGKLFRRSYNLKAHMETHDPHRDQPHTCTHDECMRRFVRRTDLLRHEQSVHIKARNYPCPLCDSSFARKDTLRRHIDDGCPRRPEMKKRTGKERSTSSTSRKRQSPFPQPSR